MSGQGTRPDSEEEDDELGEPAPPTISADRLTRFGSQAGVSTAAPPRRNPSGQKLQTDAVAEDEDDVDEAEAGDTFKLPPVDEKSLLAGPGRLGSFPSRMRLSLVVNEGAQGAPPTSQVGGPRRGPSSLPSFKNSGASTIIGHSKTIRLSVLPVSGVQLLDQAKPNRQNSRRGAPGEDGIVMPLQRTQSFTPLRLLDIENGASILVTEPKFFAGRRLAGKDPPG